MLKIAVVDDEIVFVESLINKITAVCEKLNLKFKIDNTDYTLASEKTGTIDYAIGADSMKKTITVNWEWAFGENDTAEENKNDNKSADNDWKLNIAITGKQTTPETTTATP